MTKYSSERDREDIRRMWRNLFPRETPKLNNFEVAQWSQAVATEGGGDYFDYPLLANGLRGFIVADAAGHGLPAIFLLFSLQATIRGQVTITSSCSECVTNANRLLKQSFTPDRFVTLFLSAVNDEHRTLSYCNGGHHPPYLFSPDGEVRELNKGGPLLGVFNPVCYEEETIQLSPGDVLVIYTDGVTDQTNKKGEQFGTKRLMETVKPILSRPASEIASQITFAVGRFAGNAPQSDDLTLMVIKAL